MEQARERAWLVPSETQEDIKHTVTILKNGNWECDCPAFVFGSRDATNDKHIRKVREMLEVKEL